MDYTDLLTEAVYLLDSLFVNSQTFSKGLAKVSQTFLLYRSATAKYVLVAKFHYSTHFLVLFNMTWRDLFFCNPSEQGMGSVQRLYTIIESSYAYCQMCITVVVGGMKWCIVYVWWEIVVYFPKGK